MLSNFLFSQILIAVAICVDILSFQFKEKNKMLVCLVISTVLISFHFMLLGHWTAALLWLISVARYLSGIYATSKRVMWLFLIIILVTTISSFEGLLSILGGVGTCFTTIAAFRNDDKRLRQLMFIGTMIWITHNYLAGSPGAVLMETIFLVSNLVGYFRYYIKSKYKYFNKRTA